MYKNHATRPNVHCFLSKFNHVADLSILPTTESEYWTHHVHPIVVSDDFLTDYFQCEVVVRICSTIVEPEEVMYGT